MPLNLILSILLICGPAMQPWQDPQCNGVGREPMHASFSSDTRAVSLDGTWDFRLEGVPEWGRMPVPGVWELNGVGDPVYVCRSYPWKWHFDGNPPELPSEGNRTGIYRRTFHFEKADGQEDVFLVIGAACSDVEARVNGRLAGYSEDSRLAASFDIGDLLQDGDNTLELRVMRWCDGTWLEDQDMWRMSGIFRGVSIERRPKVRLEDLHLTAGADGVLALRLHTTQGAASARLRLLSPAGRTVRRWTLPLKDRSVCDTVTIPAPRLWSAETPDLYTLEIRITDTSGALTHTASTKVGFRSVEIKGRTFLINDRPVLLKGVNRHEISPRGGYVLTRDEMEEDIRLLKSLNINAVRTSHYPDDPYWYSLCDRYGIYVMDEANLESHGVGYAPDKTLADKPLWARAHEERFRRMVARDRNHPCVVMWSLGNEAGNGANHAANYAWAKAEDPSRPVIYQKLEGARRELPWTDIEFYHYRSPQFCEEYLTDGRQVKPFMLQEYAHAMGNSLGNFKEYWDLVRRFPDSFQGGFIWDFADQALLIDGRTRIGGDFNDHDAWNASLNCNGLLTCERQMHPHAFEAAHVLRSILSSAAPEDAAMGRIKVRNEYFFRDLRNFRLDWTLLEDGVAVRKGTVRKLRIGPSSEKTMRLRGVRRRFRPGHDTVLQLAFSLKKDEGILPGGTVLARDEIRLGEATVKPSGQPSDGLWSVSFDASSGWLCSIKNERTELLSEPLTPCFGRAITENDKGAALDDKMAFWLWPEFRPISMEASVPATDGRFVFTAPGTLEALYGIGGGVRVRMKYETGPDGAVTATETLEGQLEDAPPMFRFGMECALPGRFDRLLFYGKGPFENYCDRLSAARTGLWDQTVGGQYHWGYVRPQESGNHCLLHWMAVLDGDGRGLMVTSPQAPFSGSALPLSRRMLDLSLNEPGPIHRPEPLTWQKHAHSDELLPLACPGDRSKGRSWLHIDLAQMGVGGINTWGATPLEQYMLPAAPRSFTFTLTPWKYDNSKPYEQN